MVGIILPEWCCDQWFVLAKSANKTAAKFWNIGVWVESLKVFRLFFQTSRAQSCSKDKQIDAMQFTSDLKSWVQSDPRADKIYSKGFKPPRLSGDQERTRGQFLGGKGCMGQPHTTRVANIGARNWWQGVWVIKLVERRGWGALKSFSAKTRKLLEGTTTSHFVDWPPRLWKGIKPCLSGMNLIPTAKVL